MVNRRDHQPDEPSALERYLGRAVQSAFDQSTYVEYSSRFSVDARPATEEMQSDCCEPARFANENKTYSLYDEPLPSASLRALCLESASTAFSREELGRAEN
jgi:hypothetical protein